jgi:NADPH:quinone reductase-like Zn-dependent oxidoreductase
VSLAVRFDRYGGPEVLYLADVPMPTPGEREVVVRVVATGINPGEAVIRSGAMRDEFPAHFPEGQGSDLAGVVHAVGSEVVGVDVGDPVIGMSDHRSAQAEFTLLSDDLVIPKPESLPWEVAASLYVAGITAVAMIRTVRPQAGETVLIAGAAGGVGCIATQLTLRAGATVLAVASKSNHAALLLFGAQPVAYVDDIEQEIRDRAPNGVQAVMDCHGDGYVALGLRLGVPPGRINTCIDFDAARTFGVSSNGGSAVDDQRAAVSELGLSISRGELEVPIRARYPLGEVADAYRDLAGGHGLGKIVLSVAAL